MAVVRPRPAAGRLSGGEIEVHPGSERSSADAVRVVAGGGGLYALVVLAQEGPGYLGLVARHRDDGRPDAAFGEGGRVLVEPLLGPFAADDLAVAPDGAVVVAGQAEEAGRRVAFVARWSRSGARDSSFGAEGLVRLDLGRATSSLYADARTAVAVRPDGSVVLAASVAGRPPVVASYGRDGQLDGSFGRGGVLRLRRV